MRIEDDILLISHRESEIYNKLCEGKTQTDTAKELNVSQAYINQITKQLESLAAIISIENDRKTRHNKKYRRPDHALPVEIYKPFSHNRCRECHKIIPAGRKFCSRVCMGLKMRGPSQSNWTGGSKFKPYCWKFNEPLKERVRIFFERKCFLCGCDEDPRISLSVHHIHYNRGACCDGGGEPHFVPLCERCHSMTSTSSIKFHWECILSYLLFMRTGGKCYLSRAEYRTILNNRNNNIT